MKISSADFLHLKAHERMALLAQWLASENGEDLCVQGTRQILAKAPIFLTRPCGTSVSGEGAASSPS